MSELERSEEAARPRGRAQRLAWPLLVLLLAGLFALLEDSPGEGPAGGQHPGPAPAPLDQDLRAPGPALTAPAREAASGDSPTPEGDPTPEDGPAAPGAALLHGRVLDARTGEPVPMLALFATDPAGLEVDLETDGEGRFASTRPLRYGTVRLEAASEDYGPVSLAHAPLEAGRPGRDPAQSTAGEQLVEFPVGPTYTLRLSGATGIASSDLRVVLLGAQELAHEHEGSTWREAVLRPVSADAEQAARDPDGTLWWVRLAPYQSDSAGPPWHLIVHHGTGHMHGSAVVDRNVGRYPDVLDILLSERAGLRVHCRDALSGEDLTSATVELLDANGTSLGVQGSKLHGECSFVGLTGGIYTLRASSPLHVALEQTIELVEGTEQRLGVTLEQAAGAGEVSGEITCVAGGGFLPGARVHLIATEPPYLQLSAPVEPSPDGAPGRYAIGGVPPASYELHLALTPAWPVDPSPLRVLGPTASADLRVLDGGALVDVRVRVTDASSGRRLAAARAWVGADVAVLAGRELEQLDGELVLSQPLTNLQPLYAWAPGYQLLRVEPEQLQRSEDGYRHDARLEPGSGKELVLFEQETGRLLAGLPLFADGTRLGVTDERGRLLVNLEREPGVLAAGPGWRMTAPLESGPRPPVGWWETPLAVERQR